ncbi:MAG: Hint domain-containing protein [Geminicoccaceae bacterium]
MSNLTSAENKSSGIAAGTPILMADGSLKPIEKAMVGDQVASFKGLGALRSRRVLGRSTQHKCALVSFDDLQVSPGHLFLVKTGAFRPLSEIGVSDSLVLQCGGHFAFTAMEKVAGRHKVFSLLVEGTGCYIAGGYRVRGVTLTESSIQRDRHIEVVSVADSQAFFSGEKEGRPGARKVLL